MLALTMRVCRLHYRVEVPKRRFEPIHLIKTLVHTKTLLYDVKADWYIDLCRAGLVQKKKKQSKASHIHALSDHFYLAPKRALCSSL